VLALKDHPAVLLHYGLDEAPERGMDGALQAFLNVVRGVANIWGNPLPTPDKGGSRPYAHGGVQIKERIRTYATFFREKRRFRRDLVRANGMDLSGMKGKQTAVAVDARRRYEEIDLGELPPGEHEWQAPCKSDWAIAIGWFE
jgi:hypothetical protein